MDGIKQTFDKYDTMLDKQVCDIELLNMLQQKTQVKRTYLVAAFTTVLFMSFWACLGTPFICDIVGFFYPTYMSFKAIESNAASDDRHWLTYWVVFAFLSVLEVGANFILSWFSYYYYAKLIFLIFCFHPEYKGAEKVYDHVIRPIMKRYETQVDKSVDMARKRVERAAEFAKANNSAELKKDE
jgi:receptor expression-enhancing protein 5/6